MKVNLQSLQITSLNSLYYETTSDTIVVFIGGTGDDKDTWREIIENLYGQGCQKSILTFSFSGRETAKSFPLKQEITDLTNIINYVVNTLKKDKIELVATSQGAYSACFIATNNELNKNIRVIHFIDPADYLLGDDNADGEKIHTCSGPEIYNPQSETAVMKLKSLPSHIKVNVAFLTLRNYGPEGYLEKDYLNRGKDHPNGYPRLNKDMVKKFIENVPEISQGEYIEQGNLPHGFKRDGDIKKNIQTMTNLLLKLI